MTVAICGPNLRDQSSGSFHVHAAGCADLHNYGPGRRLGGEPPWLVNVSSVQDVVEAVYADQIDESGDPWQSYVPDFHFLPCAKGLR